VPQENSHATTNDLQTVLVTGATRGLGLAIASRLIAEGYQVVGVARRPTAEFARLADADSAGMAHFVPYDMEQTDGLHDLVNQITKSYGPLYGLVNNAGLGQDGILSTMHARDIERVLRINLHAPIHLIKYASRTMMLRKEGRIVNVSSIIARTGFSGLAVYAASKAGLEGLSRSLARELGRLGITVNCVAPGYMETEMTQGLPEDQLDSVRRRSPLGLPRVEDAAAAVSYLLGPDASRITGTVITVDGGSTA
jgi:3-oxoacyl-[acyl-carrier protein] reductase